MLHSIPIQPAHVLLSEAFMTWCNMLSILKHVSVFVMDNCGELWVYISVLPNMQIYCLWERQRKRQNLMIVNFGYLCTLKLRITKYEFYRNILNMVKFATYANEAKCCEQRGCGLTTIYTAAQQRASSCWGQIHHNLLYSWFTLGGRHGGRRKNGKYFLWSLLVVMKDV